MSLSPFMYAECAFCHITN